MCACPFRGALVYLYGWSILDRCQNIPVVASYFKERYPKDDKFWLHRTDCLEKLREKGDDYAGVEFDLNW